MTPEERARRVVERLTECSTPEGAALVVGGAIREAVEEERRAVAHDFEQGTPRCGECRSRRATYLRGGVPVCSLCQGDGDELAPWEVIGRAVLARWDGGAA